MVISDKISERIKEMDNRGSKSEIFSVKEQRVDGTGYIEFNVFKVYS